MLHNGVRAVACTRRGGRPAVVWFDTVRAPSDASSAGAVGRELGRRLAAVGVVPRWAGIALELAESERYQAVQLPPLAPDELGQALVNELSGHNPEILGQFEVGCWGAARRGEGLRQVVAAAARRELVEAALELARGAGVTAAVVTTVPYVLYRGATLRGWVPTGDDALAAVVHVTERGGIVVLARAAVWEFHRFFRVSGAESLDRLVDEAEREVKQSFVMARMKLRRAAVERVVLSGCPDMVELLPRRLAPIWEGATVTAFSHELDVDFRPLAEPQRLLEGLDAYAPALLLAARPLAEVELDFTPRALRLRGAARSLLRQGVVAVAAALVLLVGQGYVAHQRAGALERQVRELEGELARLRVEAQGTAEAAKERARLVQRNHLQVLADQEALLLAGLVRAMSWGARGRVTVTSWQAQLKEDGLFVTMTGQAVAETGSESVGAYQDFVKALRSSPAVLEVRERSAELRQQAPGGDGANRLQYSFDLVVRVL